MPDFKHQPNLIKFKFIVPMKMTCTHMHTHRPLLLFTIYFKYLQQGIDSGPLFPAGVSHGSSNNSTPDRRNSPIPSSLSRLSPAPSKSKPQSPSPSGSRENQPSPGPSTSAIETEEEDEPEPGPSTEAGEEE